MSWPPPPPPEYQSAAPSAGLGEYAGWGARAGAALVDTVIVTLIILAAVAIFSATGSDDTGAAVVVLAALAGVYLYPPLTMMRSGAHNGQTFGKQAVGVRVVREDGTRIGFGWGILRELLAKGVLSIFTIPILLSYLWPLWDDRNQALHDKMASTFVVTA